MVDIFDKYIDSIGSLKSTWIDNIGDYFFDTYTNQLGSQRDSIQELSYAVEDLDNEISYTITQLRNL